MPPQMFRVLRLWDPMIGRDIHIPCTPNPGPPAPYVAFQVMYGTGLTCKYAPSVHADAVGTPVMIKGTDIGPLIPHFGPPSVTLPVEMLTSGSKSHFGPSYYVTSDQRGGTGNPAVALLLVVNPNLNCGTPAPMPFGLVLAFSTHVLALSWGDMLAGAINMALDYALQRVLYKVFSSARAEKLINGLCDGIASRLGIRVLNRAALRRLARSQGVRRNIGPTMHALGAQNKARLATFLSGSGDSIGYILGQLVGSPLGSSVSTVTHENTSVYDRAMARLFGAETPGDLLVGGVSGYLNGPGAEDLNPEPATPSPTPGPSPTPPSSTPAPSGTPTPSPSTPTSSITPTTRQGPSMRPTGSSNSSEDCEVGDDVWPEGT